jgi:hypothetical protein
MPPDPADTAAVKVTEVPEVIWVADAVSVVVVGIWRIVSVRVFEVLEENSAEPW